MFDTSPNRSPVEPSSRTSTSSQPSSRGLEDDTLGEDVHLHHHVLLGLVLQVLPGRESVPDTVSRHLEVRHAAGVQGFQERSDDQANDGRRVVLEDDQGINQVDPLQVDHLIHGANVAEGHVRDARPVRWSSRKQAYFISTPTPR